MAKAKPIDKLSSDELYELARSREQQELDEAREAAQARVEELREKRKAITAKYRKDVAAIDREIAKLGGRRPTRRRRARRGDASQAILAAIGKAGKISSADLRSALEAQGADVSNLAQRLNYLKRQGQIVSPSRAVYALAK